MTEQLQADPTQIGQPIEQARAPINVWVVFAAITVTAIVAAAIAWSLAHPYGTYWDEAQYLNEVSTDLLRLRSGHLLRLLGRFFFVDTARPPAYRILALPFLVLSGFHTTVARLASLVWFALSAWYIYAATRRVASQVAAAFAVLIFALSPEVVSASIRFGTEGPLYLAVAAMLYYAFACWDGGSERPSNWIGLGLALGLGSLSKTSFAAIAAPVLVFWIAARYWTNWGVSKLGALYKAAAIALVLAAPWWLLDGKEALGLADYARGYIRHSLGPPSWSTRARWLDLVLQCLLGHGVSIIVGLIAIAGIVKICTKKRFAFSPLQKLALGASACATLPILLTQLSGTNDLVRHVSPAVIPLAVGFGLLAGSTGWIRSRAALAASGVFFGAQLVMIIAPTVFPNTHPVSKGFVTGTVPWRVMARVDQWNWRPIREISESCGVETPTISYLGNGPTFNPPQIEFPWVPWPEKAAANFNAVWLWRFEDGPLDWQKVMSAAEQTDLVLTAPQYLGDPEDRDNLDNQNNAAFAERLYHDSRFQGPIRLEMGRFQPVEVLVFAKKSLLCHWDKTSAAR